MVDGQEEWFLPGPTGGGGSDVDQAAGPRRHATTALASQCLGGACGGGFSVRSAFVARRA